MIRAYAPTPLRAQEAATGAAGGAGVALGTTFYVDPEPARRAELGEWLRRSAANECVDEIHVLLGDGVAPEVVEPKTRLVCRDHRAAYADAMIDVIARDADPLGAYTPAREEP
jgi:hypothetical protein